MDGLQSSLLVHEQHMKGHKEEDQSQKMSNAGRGFGHGRSRGGDRRRIRTSKENVDCY